MGLADHVSPEVTVIEVASEKPPTISRVDHESGIICLKIGPTTQLRGERHALIEWFAEAGIILADNFLDDLEASTRRQKRFPEQLDYELIG